MSFHPNLVPFASITLVLDVQCVRSVLLVTTAQSVLSLPQPGLVFVCYRLRLSFIRRRGCRALRGQICDVSLMIKLQLPLY